MNQDPTLQPPQTSGAADDMERLVLKGLLLFFIAVAIYIPATSGGYIYDDDTLLTANPDVTRGSGFLNSESWKGLGTIWFPLDDQTVTDYAPLSATTLWIEWRLWGAGRPAGYHITNVLLHAAAALLLWAVLARLCMPGAWLAALVWAAHPVCAESVAWIAERRNTLSMPLLMLALLAWFRFQGRRRGGDFALALVLFALTLLAKSTAVMLPVFLLLWVWWKRNRVTARDLIEAAPLFALSLALGLVTAHFQFTRAISQEQMPIGALPHRVASACFALGFYAWNAALPFRLMFNYPEWHKTVPPGWQALAIVPFFAVFAWAWRARATWGRHLILGLGFFVIMIAPALGIMKMAYMRITLLADHFEYMPMAGLIALAAAGVTQLRDRAGAPGLRHAANAAAGGLVMLLCCLTWKRADIFHDPESLWNDTLAKNPDAWQAHEHLGGLLKERGDVRGAMEHFRRGVELRPYLGETHNNYGNSLRDVGADPEVALEENRKAVELDDRNIAARFSYAVALEQANHPREAIVQFQEVLKKNPGSAMICYQIAKLLMQTGKTAEAIDYYRETLRLAPNFSPAQQELNGALIMQEKGHNR